jgi:hypothetical protein
MVKGNYLSKKMDVPPTEHERTGRNTYIVKRKWKAKLYNLTEFEYIISQVVIILIYNPAYIFRLMRMQ